MFRKTKKHNYCYNEGYLVSQHYKLPDDPHDFYCGITDPIGCNNLYCPRCKTFVRYGNFKFKGRKKVKAKILYQTEDWNTLNELVPDERVRLYTCKCKSWVEGFYNVTYHTPNTSENGYNPPYGAQLPWVCRGHPIAVLPAKIDGIEVAHDTDMGKLAKQILHKQPAPGANTKGQNYPVLWLVRLYHRLQKTGKDEELAQFFADELLSNIKRRKGAALEFFFKLFYIEQVEVVFDFIKKNPEFLYKEFLSPVHNIKRAPYTGGISPERIIAKIIFNLLEDNPIRIKALNYFFENYFLFTEEGREEYLKKIIDDDNIVSNIVKFLTLNPRALYEVMTFLIKRLEEKPILTIAEQLIKINIDGLTHWAYDKKFKRNDTVLKIRKMIEAENEKRIIL